MKKQKRRLVRKRKPKYKDIEFADNGVTHKIVGRVSGGSYAEYLLLKRRYFMMDESWFYNHHKKGKQLLFNTTFLEDIQKEHNELHCEFCGKSHLKIYKWFEKPNRTIMATADHFFPKSSDKEKLSFEEKNMVVACDDCNGKKGSEFWSLDKIKFPYPHTLVKIKQLYNDCITIQREYARRSRNFAS